VKTRTNPANDGCMQRAIGDRMDPWNGMWQKC
jgi:hypothetical protein